jgi:hypothetical protein
MRHESSRLVLPALHSSVESPRRSSRRALLVVLLLLLALAGPASAVICTVDSVPSATLLLPYFEVDLGNPNGLTTLFSVNNASALAMLTHVVVWSDLSVPVLDFNVYLTGYDVQTINLRDVIVYGHLPQTASTLQDPSDTISPKGILSQDIGFASCNGQLPPPALPPPMIQHLQLSLTGQPSPVLRELCAGQELGDNIARGYVTVDTVSNCTLRFPGDPGYFGAGATGDATNQNVLWGTWFIANSTNQYVLGSNMVGVEADATNPATSTASRYTFYGRYNAWTATDNREPLASTFAAQFFAGGTLFSAGTDLIVWRDPKGVQQPFACPAKPNVAPDWYPLGLEGFVVFDEQEHPQSFSTIPVCPQPPTPSVKVLFPAATQKVVVNGSNFQTTFPFGWIFIDLNVAAPYQPAQPGDPVAAQAWVISAHVANGHAVAVDAYRLDSVCQANHTVPH